MLGLACRWGMWLSERLVPAVDREAWREDWAGDFWNWTLRAAQAGTPDSRGALLDHTRKAFLAALKIQFSSDRGRQAWLTRVGDPKYCLWLTLVPLIAVAIFSDGFSDSRRLLRGLPYPDSSRVIALTQGSSLLASRWGFADKEAAVFRDEAKTLDGFATYQWYRAKLGSTKSGPDVAAAHVGPGFFHVLGVKPMLGVDLSDAGQASRPFVASYDFWREELGADPGQIGKHFWINGKPMRLAGVMPKGFWFLVGDTGIWTDYEYEAPPAGGRWWLRMRSAVARVKPGVALGAVEKQLRERQEANGIARKNWGVFATPESVPVYQYIVVYAESLGACALCVGLWAAIQIYLKRRNGAMGPVFRYWGFLLLKILAPLAAVFFAVCEFTGSNTLEMAGRSWGARILGNDWVFFLSVALLVFWAIRDQRARCRVCLHYMRSPVRIGIPGQILLDTTGVEVMCPVGHGAMYTSESVLGSEMSNQWMGFEDVLR
jgi:MacB-like periplasmic core domain